MLSSFFSLLLTTLSLLPMAAPSTSDYQTLKRQAEEAFAERSYSRAHDIYASMKREGLPLAEHVTSLLAGVLGGAQAHDLVAEAGERAVSAGLPLRDVLLSVPKLEGRLDAAGITPEQIDAALEPAGYLGAADAFVAAALDAHDDQKPDERQGSQHG